MSAVLEIHQLSAGYSGSQVLHEIELELAAGETLAILGPNGHGKSTLLRVISGLMRPTLGRVIFAGIDITARQPEDIVGLGIIHVPQGDLPFPNMTVSENLLMGAYRADAWRDRGSRIERVFSLFPNLADRRRNLARTLSGGERRMLALGRGLMGDAKVMLVDEPSLGLAPRVTAEVYRAITEIRDTGMSILLVDESANHIRGLADRVCVLESGTIVAEGQTESMMRDPRLLAAYLG